jgi:DNA-damage-inducible protein D
MIDKISIFTVGENTGNMSDSQLIGLNFDQFGEGADKVTWWASDFMEMLGYPNMIGFTKVIHRAMQSCLSANIDPNDDFIRENRVVDGLAVTDYRLTRFGCYMVAMNGHIKKPQVAGAQVFFAKVTEQVNISLEGADDVERINTRHDIKEGFKSLSAVAKGVGVTDFGRFHDAGYKGMYNMSVKQLAKRRGISDKALYDHMGKSELSANLFRLNMTEEKLKVRRVTNPLVANGIHKDVGSGVRKMVYESTGKLPENLPVERKLNIISKELKKANKELNKKKD